MKNAEIIATELIELNQGQVPGLPSNPRQWTKEDLERLKKSMQETPELFAMRACIVYPHEGKYVVLGGNMRFMAASALGMSVPCYVMPEDTPVEKLEEIVIKDNGSFGAWDWDKLEAWDVDESWGVPVWKEEQPAKTAHQKEDKDLTSLDIVFTPDEFIFVQSQLLQFGDTKEEGLMFKLKYDAE